MDYCPINAWKEGKKRGLSPYEQVEVGKTVSKIINGCKTCRKNGKEEPGT